MDPAKLKVVELKNELQSRGLDTKGNKAALVQRLKEALEKETNTSLPDTSILETSTEDLDTSQSEEPPKKEAKTSEEKMEVDSNKPQPTPKTPEKTTTPASKTPEKPKVDSPAKVAQSPAKPQENKSASAGEKKESIAENGEQAESGKEAASETRESETKESTEKTDEDPAGEQKGEKRKREGDSPQREGAQKVRAKSPIKEDEPVIDTENVQLNWYDSDLHLQVDKENFLSAKPFTDGAFGYAWAGVRASHGVSKGKVCYEVKFTEEIKWEDLAKIAERRQDSRRGQKRDRDKRGKKSGDDKKTEKPAEEKEKPKTEEKTDENGEKENAEAGKETAEKKEEGEEKKDEVKTEKMDTTEEEKPAEKPIEKPEETPMETESATTVEEAKKPEDAEKKEGEKVEEEKKEPEEQIPIHLIRVGWSLLTSSLQLGEDKCSFAYESTGKFVNDKQFIDYGKPFVVGDVIGAYLNIDDEYVTIRYAVNGELQPVAATLQRSEFPEDLALFPHILTRNCAFEINLGQKEEPWFTAPDLMKEYVFLSQVEDKVIGPNRPENRGDCEVILMCGLPGSGKTHWVREHIGSNTDKRYTVIGNASLLERMTVSGNPLRSKFKGKWSIFVDRLQKCLNSLITLASQRRRNYIIDQTNVFPSAQRRKMRPFEGFKRRAVIVVVGDEEQTKRQALQESTDGKGVPDSVILEMKAAMSLPEKGDWMDDIVFAGLDEEATKEQVKKYNEAGKAAGYGTEKRFRGDRFQGRRNDFRGKGRDRNFRDRRFDSRGGKWSPRGGGGGGWRDRQDRRGPPPSRDYRGGGGRDYGSRDYGRRDSGGYNRNRNVDRSGGGGGRWSGGGGGGGGRSGGGWNQQTFGGSGYGNWGGGQGGGNQWKYGGGGGGGGHGGGYGGGGHGGGYGGGGGGGSWNYYGQYSQNQNWNSHK